MDPGDGLVAGTAPVAGRPAVVNADDFMSLGGSLTDPSSLAASDGQAQTSSDLDLHPIEGVFTR